MRRMHVGLVSILMSCTFLLSGTRRVEARNSLDGSTRKRVLDGVDARIGSTYISETLARAMQADLRARRKRGEYDGISDPAALAESLTAHLRGICHDTHIAVHYRDATLQPMDETPHTPTAAEGEAARRDSEWVNHGFLRVERLKGNVGFLDLDSFSDPVLGGDTAAAAMAFIAHCDAIIVDLRYCPGGHAAMAALISSWFLEADPVHMVDIESRAAGATKQVWSAAWVPGARMTVQPLYILTSRRTHSAAEQFAYVLQVAKRAVIVGETTKGGAHPAGRYRLDDHFAIQIPEANAVSPVTGKNWEGTGVIPDVPCDADRALATAHIQALEKLAEKDGETARGRDRKRALEAIRRDLQPPSSALTLDAATLALLLGRYAMPMGIVEIRLDGARLVAHLQGEAPVTLVPTSADQFESPEVGAQFAFQRDASGSISGLHLIVKGETYEGAKQP
jgi:hypothetical protein